MARRTLGHYRIGSRPIPKLNGLASKKVGKPSGRGTVAVVMPVTRHPPVALPEPGFVLDFVGLDQVTYDGNRRIRRMTGIIAHRVEQAI